MTKTADERAWGEHYRFTGDGTSFSVGYLALHWEHARHYDLNVTDAAGIDARLPADVRLEGLGRKLQVFVRSASLGNVRVLDAVGAPVVTIQPGRSSWLWVVDNTNVNQPYGTWRGYERLASALPIRT